MKKARRRWGGMSAGAIKLVAIAAMFIDHFTNTFVAGYYYGPPALWLHMIGRITGPVMFYFLVEGYHRTKDANRYALRLLVFAAISWLPFIYYRYGTGPTMDNFYDMNVIYTLLVGLLLLRALHEVKSDGLRALCVVLCFLFGMIGDWSWMGLVMVVLFDRFYGNFGMQAKAYGAFCGLLLVLALGQLLAAGGLAGFWQRAWPQILFYASFLVPMGLLGLYNGERGRGGRWLFYIFYPAHLLFLGLARAAFSPNF